MTSQFSATVRQARFQAVIKAFPKRSADAVYEAFKGHGQAFVRHMKKKRLSGRRAGDVGLNRVYGTLSGSLRSFPKRAATVNRVQLRVGFYGKAAVYAPVHEFGATIKGKPWLTVPLPDNLTATGRLRYSSAAKLREGGKSFLRKSNAGNLVIGFRKNKKTVLWLWILKREVKVPPRLEFRKTFGDSSMQRDRRVRVNTALREILAL